MAATTSSTRPQTGSKEVAAAAPRSSRRLHKSHAMWQHFILGRGVAVKPNIEHCGRKPAVNTRRQLSRYYCACAGGPDENSRVSVAAVAPAANVRRTRGF